VNRAVPDPADLLTERKSNARLHDCFFSTLRQEDDGLVHVRVEVELPVHPSYLTDAASGQTLAKDVGLDVTAKLTETSEHQHDARRDNRHYVVSRRPDGHWDVTLFSMLTHYAEGPEERVARDSAPTLEEAKRIAQKWETEQGLHGS
jgi:hypothetical protein